jgi:glycosyltransferase involved in cell wall biosynthesis
MIVKNESTCILRCLDSVKDYIDYWVICDTGSTDNTREIIKEFFETHNIKGELHQHEWKDFGHNRSLAVKMSKNKADYTLLMDADFILVVKDPNFKEELKKMDKDAYLIKYEGSLDYRQSLCVRTSLDWHYVGVTHEYITCKTEKNRGNFDGFTFLHYADGGCRSDKFERDIKLLSSELNKDPSNVRYNFYLAQSYKDTSQFDKAIEYYNKRIEFGGWYEEVYYSMYQRGLCKVKRGDDFWDCIGDLYQSYIYHPQRLEGLYELVKFCRTTGKYLLGYRLGKNAINNEYPDKDALFILAEIHKWMFLDEMSICAYYAGKKEKATEIVLKILNEERAPPQFRDRFYKHLTLFKN